MCFHAAELFVLDHAFAGTTLGCCFEVVVHTVLGNATQHLEGLNMAFQEADHGLVRIYKTEDGGTVWQRRTEHGDGTADTVDVYRSISPVHLHGFSGVMGQWNEGFRMLIAQDSDMLTNGGFRDGDALFLQ